MLSAEMPLQCSSNLKRNGRTLPCKTITETSSERYVVSIRMTQQSMNPFPIARAESTNLTHRFLQSHPTSRLLSRQPRPRRCREGQASLQCFPRRSQPLRIPWHQTLQLPPRLDGQPSPTLRHRPHSQGPQPSPRSHKDGDARPRNHGGWRKCNRLHL